MPAVMAQDSKKGRVQKGAGMGTYNPTRQIKAPAAQIEGASQKK